jgi:hypothetical protein
MQKRFLLILGLSALTLACGGGTIDSADTNDTGGREFITIENEGYACLQDDGTDDLSTGTVSVMLADCLTGCAADLSASCEAVVVGDSIQVTAVGEYSAPLGTANCVAVCVELTAQCPVSGISGDVTSMSYAESSVDIDFPAQDRTCTDGW